MYFPGINQSFRTSLQLIEVSVLDIDSVVFALARYGAQLLQCVETIFLVPGGSGLGPGHDLTLTLDLRSRVVSLENRGALDLGILASLDEGV